MIIQGFEVRYVIEIMVAHRLTYLLTGRAAMLVASGLARG